MVYPEGNGCLELVVTSLPESLAHMVSRLNEPTIIQVDISQFAAGDHVPKVSALCRTSRPVSPSHLTLGCAPKVNSLTSITCEVRELL